MMGSDTDDRWCRRPKRIACIGEAMIELALDSTGSNAQIGVAGDTLNTAVYLRRNWAGDVADVAYVTAIGSDPMSDRIADFIRSQQISDDLVIRCPDRMPGLYSIKTDAAGERTFSYWRDTSAARQLFQSGIGPDLDALAAFDALFLSAITLAILPAPMRATLLDWLATYRTRGGLVIFDSNYRPRLWPDRDVARRDIGRAWAQTDIGLPSVDDEIAVFGDPDAQGVMQRLKTAGVRLGALKRGEAGPLPLSGDAIDQPYPAATKIVDTTAAGDSFNGGFLASWASGGSQAEALLAGHNCARAVVGIAGAFG